LASTVPIAHPLLHLSELLARMHRFADSGEAWCARSI
jgi:hypothetical protein